MKIQTDKSTPRPWRVRQVARHNPQIEAADQSDQIVCALDHQDSDQANVELIVQAVNERERLKSIELAALSLNCVWGWVTIAHEDPKFAQARVKLANSLVSTPDSAREYLRELEKQKNEYDALNAVAEAADYCSKNKGGGAIAQKRLADALEELNRLRNPLCPQCDGDHLSGCCAQDGHGRLK